MTLLCIKINEKISICLTDLPDETCMLIDEKGLEEVFLSREAAQAAIKLKYGEEICFG